MRTSCDKHLTLYCQHLLSHTMIVTKDASREDTRDTGIVDTDTSQ